MTIFTASASCEEGVRYEHFAENALEERTLKKVCDQES